jgi:hypothetical protein
MAMQYNDRAILSFIVVTRSFNSSATWRHRTVRTTVFPQLFSSAATRPVLARDSGRRASGRRVAPSISLAPAGRVCESVEHSLERDLDRSREATASIGIAD